MKTKKISWQAIAIVVLALVLIASIALGVSGAWFQDRDDENVALKMGEEVTLDILDADGVNDPVTWNKVYGDSEAFPGDTVLETLSVKMTTDTPAIVRVKITTSIMDGTSPVDPSSATEPGEKPVHPEFRDAAHATETVEAYEERVATYEAALATWEAANDLFLLKNIQAGVAFTSNWLEGTDGYWYYKDIAHSANAVLAVNAADIVLSKQLSNHVAEWEITITVTAEAFQAANVSETSAPAGLDWTNMPSALQTTVTSYNSGRAAD